MDFAGLQAAITALGFTPPDEHRAALYLTQLQAVSTYLRVTLAGVAPGGLGNAYPLFQPALQDPALLTALCAILDNYVVPGINDDLALQNTANLGAFYAGILDPNDVTFGTNVTNFYGRHPATQRAVTTLTASFQTNLFTACQRILQNWADIEGTFADAGTVLLRLVEIRTTGSDFHKGGQQVLLLKFGGISAALTYEELRLVYKPSDVEIDCLIAGNSAAVNQIHNGFQQASLFEIINAQLALWRQANPQSTLVNLPTYRVLPYNFGSGLVPDAVTGAVPLRTSYGYLEFVEQAHDPGQSVLGYYPFGASDFKIFPKQDLASIANPFYAQVGQVTAVAATFSMTDLHMQNLIVSKYVPTPIDLENSLVTPVADPSATALYGGAKSAIEGAVNEVEEGFAAYSAVAQFIDVGPLEPQEAQNRLWTMAPPAVVPFIPYGKAALSAFTEMLRALGRQAGVFDAWFVRVQQVIVRFVPYNTADFTSTLRTIYLDQYTRDANAYATFALQFFSGKFALGPNQDPPKFLAVMPAYTQDDFRDCDVPIFYHRVSTTGIMDSRGITVAVPANVTTVDGTGVQQVVPLNYPRNTFFAASPAVGIKAAQVDVLATNNAAARTTPLSTSFRAFFQVVPGAALDRLTQ